MNGNFSRLKRAAKRYALLFSAAVGLGVGLLTTAVIMLLTKLLSAWSPLYIFIGLGAALLSGAALYLISRPTDGRFAKKLDSDYSLGERVATSVEFKDRGGAVAELQREDAEEKLGGISAAAIRPRRLIAALVLLAVSLVAITGAILVPPRDGQSAEQPLDEFDKQWILAALSELIATVDGAYMNNSLKAQTLAELRALSDFVEESEYLSEMKREAVSAVKDIDSALKSVNSASKIGAAASEGYGEGITKLAEALVSMSGASVKKALSDIADPLGDASEDDVAHAADELDAIVTASGVGIDDPVAAILRSLASSTRAAASSPSPLSGIYSSAAAELSPILIEQSVNSTVISMVVGKLCELFAISQDDLTTPEGDIEVDLRDPEAVTPGGGEDEEEEEDETISGGGLGTGETLYGSDDLIFDPNTGTYAPYGEVLQRYFDSFTEKKLDGKIPEELVDLLDEYFSALYGGSDGENDE